MVRLIPLFLIMIFPLAGIAEAASLKDCAAIPEDKARLLCYDALASSLGNKADTIESDTVIIASAPESGRPSEHQPRPSGWLPNDDPFRPLIADVDEPQFFATFGRFDMFDDDFPAALVGIGDTLGVYRWPVNEHGGQWQLGAMGAVFAQFDIDNIASGGENEGGDLINADYIVGASLSYTEEDFALRFKFFHESTHLGDEFLINNPDFLDRRINFSYEALDVIASRNFGESWRGYAGGRVLIRREPSNIDRLQLQAGIEYYGQRELFWRGHFLAGLDVRAWQQNDWEPQISLKAGIEFPSETSDNYFRLMLEAYDGHSPYGQFFDEEISYLGAGFYFGF